MEEMASVVGRSVVEVRPFCVAAAENEEVEIRFTRSAPHSTTCRVYFLHRDMKLEERTLGKTEHNIKWMARGLSPGMLNVVTVYESSNPGVYITSVTPVPVLPKDAAEEMCDIFVKTIHQETKSDLLLSRDRALSEIQKTAVREAIWHDHIRSFGVDLDFLLDDMDEENESDDDDDDDDDNSYEAMCETSLRVFRNLFEFLKKSRAHNTIQYLIQACKEHGVISFYSQYQIEEETLRNDSEIVLYECAPKCSDLVPPNNEADSDENNDMSEFYQNFGFRTSICPNNDYPSSFEDKHDASCLIEETVSMEQLYSFSNFDAFSRAGSFRDRIKTDEPSGHNNNGAIEMPQSPSSREQHEEVCLATP